MRAFHVAESSNSDHETDIPAEAMETEAVVENVQPKPPTVGMGFTSESEVQEFYNEYAKAAGFGIAKIRTKNDEDGRQKYFSRMVFDGYVNSGTTLRQFVEQYDSALKDKMKKESSAEFLSFNCFIPTISDHPIEQQFQAVYTNDMFKLFQGEFRGLMYCNASLVKKEGSLVIFEVTENKIGKDGSYWKKFVYDVTYHEVSHVVKCLCCLFECKGLLSKHALSVLIKENVFEVPSCYILDLWRKDIKRHYLSIKGVYDDSGGHEQRRRHISMLH